MRFSFRPTFTLLAVAALLFAPGCGGGEGEGTADTSGTAKGSDDGKGTQSGGPGTPATDRPIADPLHPKVVIETSLGNMVVELDAEKAEITVGNFLSYVDRGDYDRTIFHQVIKDYPRVIIGGAYNEDLSEKKGTLSIYNEARKGLKNKRGTIAMARRPDVIDSATRHFFINLTDNEALDYQDDSSPENYGYCVFGKVVKGLEEVADKIGSVEVQDKDDFERIPVETVMIRSIRRL